MSSWLSQNENGEYIFKGEYPNNYVKFDDKTWRILKINRDGSIKLISAEKKLTKDVWDDRYNIEKSNNVGINNFSVSRILETLQKMYNEDTAVSKKNKKSLVKQAWCIDKLSDQTTSKSDFNTCTDTYDNLYVGLINVIEVIEPSLDENCTTIYSESCTNYNYLYEINTGWTLNTSSENTYKVFSSGYASISIKNASANSIIRPVINVNSNILYKKGNGTKDTPYEI